MYMGSFTFRLVHCGSMVSTLVLSSETECPVALQWSPTPVGMVRLVCSLKRFPNGRLVSPMYTIECRFKCFTSIHLPFSTVMRTPGHYFSTNADRILYICAGISTRLIPS